MTVIIEPDKEAVIPLDKFDGKQDQRRVPLEPGVKFQTDIDPEIVKPLPKSDPRAYPKPGYTKRLEI